MRNSRPFPHIRNIVGLFRYLFLIPGLGLYWSVRLGIYGVKTRGLCFDKKTKKLFLEDLGIYLSKERHVFFLKEYNNLIIPLVELEAARFLNDERGDLVIDVHGLRLLVQTWEELVNLSEIFLKKVYDFDYGRPVIILDIGMNVGFSSLYFASRQDVRAVFGYEPFKRTYEHALRNFSLNPEIAEKINSFNVGVGSMNAERTLDYCPDWKGTMSTLGFAGSPEGAGRAVVREEVVIKDVAGILDSILEGAGECEVIAKIDCEGSEYEILEALNDSNKLPLLRALIVEWHSRGPEDLIRCLEASGFLAFSSRSSHSSNAVGMIYAVRTSVS